MRKNKTPSSTQRETTQPTEVKTLILLTKGTYGRFDDAYSGIQLGLTTVVEGRKANILLIGDGVFAAVRDQDPAAVGKSNLSRDLADFLDLRGEVYALRQSLARRGLARRDLLERIRVVNHASAARLIQTHNNILTF